MRRQTTRRRRRPSEVTITPDLLRLPGHGRHPRRPRQRAGHGQGYPSVHVKLVLAPAWTTDWMTEAGKAKLQEYGIAPPVGHSGAVRHAGPVRLGLAVKCPQLLSLNTQRTHPLRFHLLQGAVRRARTARNRSTTSKCCKECPMTVVRQTAAESAAATGRRRASFHPLTVDEVRRLTDDAIEVTFAVPDELAGQFDYLPGPVRGPAHHLPDERAAARDPPQLLHLRRAAQLRDGSSEIRVAIKKDLGGLFSTWANAEAQGRRRPGRHEPHGRVHLQARPRTARSRTDELHEPSEALAGEPGPSWRSPPAPASPR